MIDLKKETVYEPFHTELQPFYELIKDSAPMLDGSPLMERLVAVYNGLRMEREGILWEECTDSEAFELAHDAAADLDMQREKILESLGGVWHVEP